MQPFSYIVLGLRLQSEHEIPGLFEAPAAQVSAPDVSLHLGYFPRLPSGQAGDPCYTSPNCDIIGSPVLVVTKLCDGEYFQLYYHDGVEFLVDRLGQQIWVRWPGNFSTAYISTYLLGPVMAFVLRLRGTVALHASAVIVDDAAVAFMGGTGSGKSTIAAAFAKAGRAVLTDDVLPLWEGHGRIWAQPGYPRIRLWPEASEDLYGSPEALPPICEGWGKRSLTLETHFQETALPLRTVYVLDGRTSGNFAIRPLAAGESLIALVANTCVNYLIDSRMRAFEFEVLTRVVTKVPVRSLTIPSGGKHLAGVCRDIEADARAVIAPSRLASQGGARVYRV